MKIALSLILLSAPLYGAVAENALSSLKEEWRMCASDQDCGVIHVNGCPWDSIPVTLKHAEEVRAWAKRENMRHNCAREAISEELKNKMRAHCLQKRCEFVSMSHPE